MKPDLCPDFPVMVGDWLASTSIALMTPAEEGAYWRLLCHAWNDPDCCLPDNDDALAQLSRLGPAWHQGSGAKIRKNFEPDTARIGFVFNRKQRATRAEQAKRIAKVREQRKAAINARWDRQRNARNTGRNTTVIRENIREGIRGDTSSPLSHSSSSSYAEIPTLAEVVEFGAKYPGDMSRGVPGPIPSDFCEAYFEAKEKKQTWLNRDGFLVNWRMELAGSKWWRDQWRTWGKRNGAEQPQNKEAIGMNGVPLDSL